MTTTDRSESGRLYCPVTEKIFAVEWLEIERITSAFAEKFGDCVFAKT